MSTQPDDHTRASGTTPAVEEAHEAAASIDVPLSPENVGEDIDREHRAPRFMRMRFNWNDQAERQMMRQAHHEAEIMVVREFADAWRIIGEIQSLVRIPVVREGEQAKDDNGELVWERTPGGRIIEDYTQLTRDQMTNYLAEITVNLFRWEQTRERMWMDSMLARGQYEEVFAISYDGLRTSGSRSTVDDRREHAVMNAAEARYFAIFMTSVSRRSDSIIGSMVRLSQRLKDIVVS